MLSDELYTVASLQRVDGRINATLEINQRHGIFKGHFPGQPVLPGACMLQILKEITETALNKKIRLKKADQIKFLALIDPTVSNTLQLDISYTQTEDDLKVNATMSS